MLHFIAILFFAVLAILLLGASLLWNLLCRVLGMGPRRRTTTPQSTSNPSSSTTAKPRRKVFDKEDGEYVEYEEV